MKAFNLICVTAAAMMAAGCTSVRSGERASLEWSGPKRDLGKVVVLQHLGDAGNEELRESRAAEARGQVHAKLAALPGTEVVEAEALETALGDWRTASDYQAVMAARSAGVDTLCLMDLADYNGSLSVGFNPLPGWWTGTNVAYHLRVINARDGSLIADTRRCRSATTWLGVELPETTGQVLAADLNELLELQ